MINRWLYTQLWKTAPPLIRRYLKKRADKSPAYLDNWDERFGAPLHNPVQQPIWIHAVSVGETRAAQPLITALRRYFADAPLLLTQMTPTGRAAAEELFPMRNAVICRMTSRNGLSNFCVNTSRGLVC